MFVPVAIVALCAGVAAASERAFSVVFDHYEAIREALIENSTDAVSTHAKAIADEVSKLAAGFDAESAEVDPSDADAVQALLPEVRDKAEKLASAVGLAETREAFSGLTQPLVRWHKLVQGPRPVVVYCPMEKKAWLQPDEAIGNPYAPSMLRCGEVVQR